MVALNMHSILRFHHRHSRVLAQNVRQKALVIRRQMLDDNKRHSRIAGKEREKLLQRFKSSRRSSDSHHTAGLRVLFYLLIIHIFTHKSLTAFKGSCFEHLILFSFGRFRIRISFHHFHSIPFYSKMVLYHKKGQCLGKDKTYAFITHRTLL